MDILLDGSASQNRQQEKLATQAYILVESLTRCAIPVRVMAFCSVSGCTVLRVLREYDKPEENERVFDYVSAGWNRDGLALRAAAWLMRRAQSQNRLLLILSDASPNDDQRIPIGALPLGGYSYSGKRGVDDTAAEAGQLELNAFEPVIFYRQRRRAARRPKNIRPGHGAHPVGGLVCRRREPPPLPPAPSDMKKADPLPSCRGSAFIHRVSPPTMAGGLAPVRKYLRRENDQLFSDSFLAARFLPYTQQATTYATAHVTPMM